MPQAKNLNELTKEELTELRDTLHLQVEILHLQNELMRFMTQQTVDQSAAPRLIVPGRGEC